MEGPPARPPTGSASRISSSVVSQALSLHRLTIIISCAAVGVAPISSSRMWLLRAVDRRVHVTFRLRGVLLRLSLVYVGKCLGRLGWVF